MKEHISLCHSCTVRSIDHCKLDPDQNTCYRQERDKLHEKRIKNKESCAYHLTMAYKIMCSLRYKPIDTSEVHHSFLFNNRKANLSQYDGDIET